MVPRLKQYGYDYLYVYPNSGTVCDHGHDDHYGESEYRSNLHPSASDLSRGTINGFTNHVQQWHFRNLVPRLKQYGYDYLYVYPNSGTVCDHGNDDHYGEPEYRSHLHPSTSHLSRGTINGFTNHVQQWHFWNLVPSFKQYGYDYLYVYPNSGSVCDHGHDDHYGEPEYRSNLHPSASNLSRRTTNGFTNHVQQWHYRNLVPRLKQYGYDYLYVYPKYKCKL